LPCWCRCYEVWQGPSQTIQFPDNQHGIAAGGGKGFLKAGTIAGVASYALVFLDRFTACGSQRVNLKGKHPICEKIKHA